MVNEKGYSYRWKKLDDKRYSFIIHEDAMENCKLEGFAGQDIIDMKNVYGVYPVGGPIIKVGYMINNKTIKKISCGPGVIVEVE